MCGKGREENTVTPSQVRFPPPRSFGVLAPGLVLLPTEMPPLHFELVHHDRQPGMWHELGHMNCNRALALSNEEWPRTSCEIVSGSHAHAVAEALPHHVLGAARNDRRDVIDHTPGYVSEKILDSKTF